MHAPGKKDLKNYICAYVYMVKLIRLKIFFFFFQLRERKKKLAEEKTELVAYVDASRRCVTDAMGQKVGF